MIEYKILFDKGLGNNAFVELQSGVTDEIFTAFGLTAGTTYAFQVVMRTAFATSPVSNSVEILAAEVPATPDAPIVTKT